MDEYTRLTGISVHASVFKDGSLVWSEDSGATPTTASIDVNVDQDNQLMSATVTYRYTANTEADAKRFIEP